MWFSNIISRARRGKVSDYILSEFEKRNISIDYKIRSVKDRFIELDKFYEENGRYPKTNEGNLGSWLKNIRENARRGKASDYILSELEKRNIKFAKMYKK